MQQNEMQGAVQAALDFGFSHACVLDAATLNVRTEVRDACAENKCGEYGRTWCCPPGNGSLEENVAQMQKFKAGIIVQTTGQLRSNLDWNGMVEAAAAFGQQFRKFKKQLSAQHPQLLALGAGGCKACEVCTYPGAPCRLPDEATCSMEGYGLVVSEVCKQNGIPYYYGDKTITYVGCYLLA